MSDNSLPRRLTGFLNFCIFYKMHLDNFHRKNLTRIALNMHAREVISGG